MTHAPAKTHAPTTRTTTTTAMTMTVTLSSDDEPGSISDPGSMIDSTEMVGSDSTVMPSAVEAASAVPKVEVSEVCIASTVMEAGMEMVTVMRTLAAATRIMTSDLSTPVASANFCCQLNLSLSE